MALSVRGQMLPNAQAKILLEQNNVTKITEITTKDLESSSECYNWPLTHSQAQLKALPEEPGHSLQVYKHMTSHQSIQISDVLLWKKIFKANLKNSGLSRCHTVRRRYNSKPKQNETNMVQEQPTIFLISRLLLSRHTMFFIKLNTS